MLSLQQIAALTILFHVAYYVSSRGWALTATTFLPVFGIAISPRLRTGIISTTILSSVLAFLWSNQVSSWILCISIAAYFFTISLRVSNHIFLAFMISILALFEPLHDGYVGEDFRLIVAFSLIISVYGFSFLHKLNRDFLSPECSSALRMCDRFFVRFDQKLARAAVPLVILASYLVVPLLLANEALFPIGMAIGLALHILYGLSGNPHFSFLMALLYMQFQDLGDVLIWVLFPAVFLAGVSIQKFRSAKPRWVFQHPICGHTLIFALNVLQFSLIISLMFNPISYSPDTSKLYSTQMLAYCCIGVMLVANCLSPYLIGKTEFCLAMFSNMRADRNNHLFLKNKKIASEFFLDYYSIVEAVNLESARRSDDRIVRHISNLIDRREHFLYTSNFIRSARSFLAERGVNDVILKTDRPLESKSSSLVFKPYMLPLDDHAGVMG